MSEAVTVAGSATSPDKGTVPKTGLTKRDLAEYYVAVAGRCCRTSRDGR